MEGVLDNLKSTTELLAVVETDIVKQWDKQTLDRAFQWTLYCQHLHSRFYDKRTIRNILEKHLQTTNDCLRATFPGYTDIAFVDLSRCQHILLTKLLNNPVLPRAIMEILFGNLSPMETNENGHQDTTGHCNQLIAWKSAYKVLRAMPVRPVACPSVDAEIQGMLLMETLDAVIGGEEAHGLLESMLQKCEEEDNFLFVIASALTRKANTTAELASHGFLLNWLQKNEQLLQKMCLHVPVDYIMSQVKENMEFRVIYCDLLKRWASDLTFDIYEGEWVATGTAAGISFKKLTDHFVALVEISPLLREEVEKELHALKIADGDFDVKGLSVWGDLLAVLSK